MKEFSKARVVIIENYPRRYPHHFYEELKRSNKLDVSICYFGNPSQSYTQIHIVENKLKGDYFYPNSIFHIQFWKKIKGSIVIVSGFSKLSFLFVIFIIWLTNRPLINWSEDVQINGGSYIKKWLWMLYAKLLNTKKASAFAISNNAKKQLMDFGVREEKIKIMPYATNLNSYQINLTDDQEIRDFSKGRKVFLFCGAYCKRKGIDLLIKAFSEIESDDWVLVLVGKNISGNEFLSILNSTPKREFIFDRGSVSYNRISSIYKAADVFILPSRYDGWGSALSEAASAGMPLISTLGCGASEHLIESGSNGYIVDLQSYESIKSAMINYVNNNELIEKHSHRSLEISKRFDSKVSTIMFEKYIEDLKIY
jgi:glycosyltransferase involved in cell wall biosynthesis